ncbi:tetratricopeptide repeat protein [Urechidicola vernalis]|uniref:HTH luxR-type domain-containing protein n=1 Tax=Urechidicola vernalis TaxID=3075600 RepID=A0ABU2Y334_9FLAO|nr:hypothetical protein [Urechidicola sp. P050]MDT0552107.1 hypothetical protein [Urechidicola sp. P050]
MFLKRAILYSNYALILFLFCGLRIVSAQNQSNQSTERVFNQNKIDSLKTLLKNQNITDKERIKAYYNLSWYYIPINRDSTFHYAELRKSYYQDINYDFGLVTVLVDFGRLLGTYNDLDGGVKYFEEAYSYYDQLEEDVYFLIVCIELGEYFHMKSKYHLAIKYYLEGLESAKRQESKLYESYFSRYLSESYVKTEHYEAGLEYIKRSVQLFSEMPKLKNQYAFSRIILANVYFEMGSYALAKEHLHEAETYIKKANIDSPYIYPLLSIYSIYGQISYALGDNEKAIENFLKAQEYASEATEFNELRNFNLANVHNYLGDVYLEEDNTAYAINEFRSALNFGKELNSLEIMVSSYRGLYEGYLNRKEIDSVKFYLDKHKPVSDSFNHERANRKIDELTYINKLAIEKERHENEIGMADLTKKRQQLYFGVIALLLISGLIIISFFGYIQKNRALKTKIKNDNLSLEKENLSLTLDKKERELTASVLNLIERNEFISRLTDDLKSISFNDEQAFQIKEIIKSTTINDSKKLWTEFELRYTQNNTALFNKLNDLVPNLTTNDKRLVALIMLNFSTKEISSITYQSPHSIKIARYRLRKKLDLSKNENLIHFFNNL